MITQEQLDLHALWFRTGGEEGVQLVCSGADLRGADLSGVNLSFADLTGANLRSAIIIDADLNGAVLTDKTRIEMSSRLTDVKGLEQDQ